MMEKWKLSLLILGIILLGSLAEGCTWFDESHDHCNIWTYNDCWCHFDDHVKDLDSSIVPTYTEEELTPICNAYDDVSKCITRFVDNCHPSLQNQFESVDDSWHYICEETKEEFLTHHRECLDNEELHEQGDEICYADLTHHLDALISNSEDTLEEKFQKQCHLVNNYLDCVENLILSYECDISTALWQRELDRRWIDPLLSGTGCELHNSTDGRRVYEPRSDGHQGTQTTGESSQHSPIPTGVIVGCTVVLGIIILVIGLLVVYKCLANKKQQNSRDANPPAPQTNQPTAYSQPYGYGGGAVAFGVFNDPLPGKDEEKGDFPTDNPPEYSPQEDGDTAHSPPSQPPPYTGFPQSAVNPLYIHSNNTTVASNMPGVDE